MGKNTLVDSGNITIRSLANNRAMSDSFGITVGTLSVGVMLAESDTKTAAGGLLAAGTGSKADASTEATAMAEVGNNVRLTSRAMNITATATTDADAESQAITVASSRGRPAAGSTTVFRPDRPFASNAREPTMASLSFARSRRPS